VSGPGAEMLTKQCEAEISAMARSQRVETVEDAILHERRQMLPLARVALTPAAEGAVNY
jgi:hypothetical protein